jgi:hypothetical protein
MKDLIAFGFQQIKRVGPIIKQMLIEIRNWSWSWSQQSRFSRQFEKQHLDSRDFLVSLKNDISTNLDNFYAIKSRFVLIFIFVSIETLDRDSRSRHWQRAGLDSRENLDTSKKLVSTLRTFSISISISIGLDCRDPHAYLNPMNCFIIFGFVIIIFSIFSAVTRLEKGR